MDYEVEGARPKGVKIDFWNTKIDFYNKTILTSLVIMTLQHLWQASAFVATCMPRQVGQ